MSDCWGRTSEEHWGPWGAIPAEHPSSWSLGTILQSSGVGFSWQSSLSRSRQASPWVTSWRSSSLARIFAEGDRLLNLDA